MEERNELLRTNLGSMYTWNVAAACCILMVIIPLINLVAVVVGLIAAIMIFLAVYRLRTVHEDYHTALILSLVNVVLTLIGNVAGGSIEGIIGVASSVISLAQTYYIIRGTNFFLMEAGYPELVEKGNKTVKLYVAEAVVSVISNLVALMMGEDGVIMALVILIVTLIVSIAAMVGYIKYLGAAKDCF